jgi:hypothetical protein
MRATVRVLGFQNNKEKIIIKSQAPVEVARTAEVECSNEVHAFIRRVRRKARMKHLTAHR